MKALLELTTIFNSASSFNYYQNEAKFNSVYSRSNLPKIIDGMYAINVYEFKSIGSHCIGLHVNALKFNILC